MARGGMPITAQLIEGNAINSPPSHLNEIMWGEYYLSVFPDFQDDKIKKGTTVRLPGIVV
jgi:hypothetical protein